MPYNSVSSLNTTKASSTTINATSSTGVRRSARQKENSITLQKALIKGANTIIKQSKKTITKKEPAVKKTTTTEETAISKKKSGSLKSLVSQEERKLLSNGLRGRITRARGEKIYVISRVTVDDTQQEYKVTGSTGNVYSVSIGPRIHCNCRDFRYRRMHCKHVLMILLKMFRLPVTSNFVQTLSPSYDDLHRLFSTHTLDPTALIPQELKRQIDRKLHGETAETEIKAQRKPLKSTDCPVCCDEFEEENSVNILFCLVCGNNIHDTCFNMWKKTAGKKASCVYCRSPWEDPHQIKIPYGLSHNHEGYVNFGSELGLSSLRDTSTYGNHLTP